MKNPDLYYISQGFYFKINGNFYTKQLNNCTFGKEN